MQACTAVDPPLPSADANLTHTRGQQIHSIICTHRGRTDPPKTCQLHNNRMSCPISSKAQSFELLQAILLKAILNRTCDGPCNQGLEEPPFGCSGSGRCGGDMTKEAPHVGSLFLASMVGVGGLTNSGRWQRRAIPRNLTPSHHHMCIYMSIFVT